MGNTIDTSNRSYSSSNESKSGTIGNAAKEILGKDDFLKLLVTELSNQDPLSPMDNKDMITQMAQFSTVEQMNNMSSAMEKLGSGFTALFQHSLLSQGASMIGKYVAGMNVEGTAIVEGYVESVQWLDGNPQLIVKVAEDKYSVIDLNEIVSVADEPKVPETKPDPEPVDPDSGTVDSGTGTEDDKSEETGESNKPTVPDTEGTDHEMKV